MTDRDTTDRDTTDRDTTDRPSPADLDTLMALLREPSTCYVTTLMPDGSPQLTKPGSTPTGSTS
jgi:hypothetical protein